MVIFFRPPFSMVYRSTNCEIVVSKTTFPYFWATFFPNSDNRYDVFVDLPSRITNFGDAARSLFRLSKTSDRLLPGHRKWRSTAATMVAGIEGWPRRASKASATRAISSQPLPRASPKRISFSKVQGSRSTTTLATANATLSRSKYPSMVAQSFTIPPSLKYPPLSSKLWRSSSLVNAARIFLVSSKVQASCFTRLSTARLWPIGRKKIVGGNTSHVIVTASPGCIS